MASVLIGIGSNLGSREKTCLRALCLVSERAGVLKKQSLMHETRPWGVEDQPAFINMAAEIETEAEPRRLLKILKQIEEELGREETYRWGPRTIDLDILFYDDLVLDTPDLTVPHPLLHEREFVLLPLAEIAPDKVHPVMKKTVRELLSEITRS
jgi:2-amino-4-hydroxy-6-hydroxymethyldihydropteridine diphosphokinase